METGAPRSEILSKFLIDHPESVVVTLMKSDSHQIVQLIKKTPIKSLIPTLSLLPISLLEESLSMLENSMLSSIIGQLRVNLVGAIFHQWNIKKRVDSSRIDTILLMLEPQFAMSIKRLLEYSVGSIGSIMNPIPFSVKDNISAGEILVMLKKEKSRYCRYVYVIDDESALKGVIPFKEVFYAKKDALVSTLMSLDVFSFYPENSIKKTYDDPCWKKWDTVPVVDKEKCLIGSLRLETLNEQVSMRDNNAVLENNEISEAGNAVSEVFQIGISATISALMLPLEGSKKS